jgi:Mn-dependent DtxR family transcriptional regulator
MAAMTFSVDDLLSMRRWTRERLASLLSRGVRESLLVPVDAEHFRLTETGAAEAARVTRNHRLSEAYLLKYAAAASDRADTEADQIEHVLEPDVLAELTQIMEARYPPRTMPPSPHPLGALRTAVAAAQPTPAGQRNHGERSP